MGFDLRDPLLVIAVLLVAWVWSRILATYARRSTLPPGPIPLPFVGNAFDVPPDSQWLTYKKWAERYGDIVYIHIFGQPMVIINSTNAALDLLQNRSANYSDRLLTPMMCLAGWEWNLGAMRYGAEWRRHRRLFHQYFNQNSMKNYRQVQRKRTREYLQLLQGSFADIVDSTKFAFGAMILEIVFGFESKDSNKFYIELNDQALESVVETFVPGKYWVDFVPLLKYVPAWMPGASFKRKCAAWKDLTLAVRGLPFAEARDAFNDHPKTIDSVTATMLSKLLINRHDESYPEDEELAKNVAAAAYIAGADTTMLTMRSFFLAMTLHPEILRKAQDELDAVVGPDRLPELEDRSSLLYVNALLKECLRWHPVAPLGIPHRSIADDEYNGYHIPKGSVVIANSWAILHDPYMYPQPEVFNPARYIKDGKLDPNVKDPATACFGFGRRVCPGRHLADSTLFLAIASVLHVFDIAAPRDRNGHSIPQEYSMVAGFMSYPTGFDCTIRSRSKRAEALIHTADT